MRAKQVTVDGVTYDLRYSTRRYGSKTFTWVDAVDPDGNEYSLGDPWQGHPYKADVVTSLKWVLRRHIHATNS